jgi:site-specific DNA recombinase
MKAVIYARVSSDPRDTGRSVDEQEAECRQVCAREGWTVTRVFVDNDRGASRHSRSVRPQYLALREFLAAGGADVLVLWEGSRAQRDVRDYVSLRDLCADRGIRYSYSGRTYDLTRTDDRFSTGLDALLAEREADVTRDRVLRAVRANAAKGRPHGKLAYGYTREYDERGQFVAQVELPEQAEIVRECARRSAGGESLYAIAQDLNARGVPAPRGGQWIPMQIKRLVTNPRYIGQRVHQGVVVGPAVWPAILEEKVWAECVRIMSDPRRTTVRDRSLKHLLSGVLRAPCGGCTRVIKNRGYNAYICHDDFCVSIRTTHAEDFVADMMIARLEQQDLLQALAAKGENASPMGQGSAELRARLDGFYEAAALGQITPGALAKIEARLLPEIEAAQLAAQTAPVPTLLRDTAGPDAREKWQLLTVGQQRWMIDQLAELRVSHSRKGARFTFRRLGDSRWKGDPKTWAEHWDVDEADTVDDH